MTPLITVIIPAYNCAATIKQSVCSVLEQTTSDLELIIIDDGSSDQTVNLLTRLAAEDSRIVFLQNNLNMGVAVTRNQGLELAKGRYIAFLDSDDIWNPDKLEKQLALLERTGGDLCYTSYTFIDSTNTSIGNNYQVPGQISYQELLCENVIGLSTVLIRREALQNLRFDNRWFHEDYVLWLAILRAGKTARGLQEALVQYRIGGRSSNKLKAAKNRWIIYREAEGLSFLASIYCLFRYFLAAMRKYRRI